MEGNSSQHTGDESTVKMIRFKPNVSFDSSSAETSDGETSCRTNRKGRTMVAVDLDAIEPLEESLVETESITTGLEEPRLNVAAIHKGVIIIQAVIGLAAIMVKVLALVLPRWVCNTEMLRNGTSFACCGPWKICDTLLSFDNEVAFDSFEEIGSLGVANISLLCFFCVIALIETAPPPQVCVEVPWFCFMKVKMIISCCISIIYAVIISLFHQMIADLRNFGFRAGDSIHIVYVGFVSSILLFGMILVEYCAITLRKDPPLIF